MALFDDQFPALSFAVTNYVRVCVCVCVCVCACACVCVAGNSSMRRNSWSGRKWKAFIPHTATTRIGKAEGLERLKISHTPFSSPLLVPHSDSNPTMLRVLVDQPDALLDGEVITVSDDYKRRQAEAVGESVAKADVVITTAQVPGAKAPMLVPKAMVETMKPGAVIVDLAIDQGGNCELSQLGTDVVHS